MCQSGIQERMALASLRRTDVVIKLVNKGLEAVCVKRRLPDQAHEPSRKYKMLWELKWRDHGILFGGDNDCFDWYDKCKSLDFIFFQIYTRKVNLDSNSTARISQFIEHHFNPLLQKNFLCQGHHEHSLAVTVARYTSEWFLAVGLGCFLPVHKYPS